MQVDLILPPRCLGFLHLHENSDHRRHEPAVQSSCRFSLVLPLQHSLDVGNAAAPLNGIEEGQCQVLTIPLLMKGIQKRQRIRIPLMLSVLLLLLFSSSCRKRAISKEINKKIASLSSQE